jgi:hypothetical protein
MHPGGELLVGGDPGAGGHGDRTERAVHLDRREDRSARQSSLSRVLTTLSFATGAAGFVVPFGLLIAGIAVPSLILKLLPRGVAWAGLVIAALGMLATLTLLNPALDLLLPIGRFGGLIWLVVASVLLPTGRRPRTAGAPADLS